MSYTRITTDNMLRVVVLWLDLLLVKKLSWSMMILLSAVDIVF